LTTVIAKVQAVIVNVLILLLLLVVVLSTVHLGVLIAEEMWKRPMFLIPVEDLLQVFGYFLLVLIGVELLETLRGYFRHAAIQVRVVLEVALIAVARKVITMEPATVSALTLFGIAALIVALAIAFYFESETRDKGAHA